MHESEIPIAAVRNRQLGVEILQNMSQPHKITFGKLARTLAYEEPECQFVFGFEQGSDGVTRLEHHIPQQQYVPRYRTAFERTKEFLQSRGQPVEIHGDYWVPKNLTPSDITERIRLELAQNKGLPPLGFVIEDQLVSPNYAPFKAEGSHWPWMLWTVLLVPRSSIQVVFDECSSQFGLVENDKFEGFSGNFLQTLADLWKALCAIRQADS
jgi:hypothetical protein